MASNSMHEVAQGILAQELQTAEEMKRQALLSGT
jgi:hypothetical protein